MTERGVEPAAPVSHLYALPLSEERIGAELREAQAALNYAWFRIACGEYRPTDWAELADLLERLGRIAPEARKRNEQPIEMPGNYA